MILSEGSVATNPDSQVAERIMSILPRFLWRSKDKRTSRTSRLPSASQATSSAIQEGHPIQGATNFSYQSEKSLSLEKNINDCLERCASVDTPSPPDEGSLPRDDTPMDLDTPSAREDLSCILPFLSLPAEMRNRVYELCLPHNLVVDVRSYRYGSTDVLSYKPDRTMPQECYTVFRINRQTRYEAYSIFYRQNTFRLSIHDLTRFLGLVGELNCLELRSLAIRHCSWGVGTPYCPITAKMIDQLKLLKLRRLEISGIIWMCDWERKRGAANIIGWNDFIKNSGMLQLTQIRKLESFEVHFELSVASRPVDDIREWLRSLELKVTSEMLIAVPALLTRLLYLRGIIPNCPY